MVAPVRRRDDFESLSRSRARGRSGPLWVARIPWREDDAEPVRVAYAVPRSVGGAVVRNRIRRRLRPMMAQRAAAGLPRGVYLVGAREGAADLSAAELRRHLDVAIAAATRRRGD